MSYAKVCWASPCKEEHALRKFLWGNTTYLSLLCLRLISVRCYLIISKLFDCTGAFDFFTTSPQSSYVHKHLLLPSLLIRRALEVPNWLRCEV